jgi:hypothetical protein
MVVHQDITVEFDGIKIEGLVQKPDEAFPVCVIPVEALAFIAAAGNVVNGIGILDAERARHGQEYGISGQGCQG